jgi:drug/metabolite transporter (DMT)-like permease
LKSDVSKAYLKLHIAIVLFGFTAILGKLIEVREIVLVWHRLWITCLSLLFVPGIIKLIRITPTTELKPFAWIGVATALHWITFYGSIKYSNVSVTLSCLATTSLFTSILEPLVFKRKISKIELMLGILVLFGIYIITSAALIYTTGIILGLLSAVLASVFTTLNKKHMGNTNPILITFVQLGSGFLLISLLIPFYILAWPQTSFLPSSSDWFWLIVLSLLCTSVAYVLALSALKHISAFNANLSVNLEPVYGIVLAAIIFGEHQQMTQTFYLGTLIIMASVIASPLIKYYLRKKSATLLKIKD